MSDPDRHPGLRGNIVATVLFVATILALWGLGKFDAVAAITALIGISLVWGAYIILARRRSPAPPK